MGATPVTTDDGAVDDGAVDDGVAGAASTARGVPLPPGAGSPDAVTTARAALLGPPAWLVAVTDAERVTGELRAVLDGSPIPAGAAPPRLVACVPLDVRARGPEWKVRYRVALGASRGEVVDVVLAGRAVPPAEDVGDGRRAGRGAGAGTPAGAGTGPGTATPGTATSPATDTGAAAGTQPELAGHATGEPGTVGWTVHLPALGLELRCEVGDRRLPAAAVLLDPSAARGLLEDALTAEHPGLRLAACTPVVVRYVFGARCTVVYRLAYSEPSVPAGPAAPHPEAWPDAVVAKAHADGEGGRVDAAMRSLWATPLARGEVVRVARPLGYLPGPGVLLQGVVPGDRTVREVLAGVAAGDDPGPAREILRRVADGLAALHGSGALQAPARRWADDLERARRTVARLHPTWPAAAGALAPLLDALADRADATVPSPARPAHGAFRPSQVLVDGDRIGFLDLDGFCLAEPERDVGRFTKSVAKALLLPAAAPPAAHEHARALSRSLTGALVARYAARAPLALERVALWEALDVVAGLAHTAATLRPGADPLLRLLDDLVDGPLDGPLGGPRDGPLRTPGAAR